MIFHKMTFPILFIERTTWGNTTNDLRFNSHQPDQTFEILCNIWQITLHIIHIIKGQAKIILGKSETKLHLTIYFDSSPATFSLISYKITIYVWVIIPNYWTSENNNIPIYDYQLPSWFISVHSMMLLPSSILWIWHTRHTVNVRYIYWF